MKSHRRVLVIVFLGVTASLFFLSYSVFGQHKNPATPIVHASNIKLVPQPVFHKESSSGLLPRLQIPKLKVDAHILYMGLTKAGDMDVPLNIKDVGWYKYGPHPGDNGSAVIAGHLDGLKGEAGVFVDLKKLQIGDSVLIVDNKGQTTAFVVRETRTYNQTENPGEIFNSSDGAHLNLITCTGAWDKTHHSFSKRLVVFADKSG